MKVQIRQYSTGEILIVGIEQGIVIEIQDEDYNTLPNPEEYSGRVDFVILHKVME